MFAYAIEKSEPVNTDSARLLLLDSILFARKIFQIGFRCKWVLSSSDRCLARLLLQVQRTR